jgi:hypothetical protein
VWFLVELGSRFRGRWEQSLEIWRWNSGFRLPLGSRTRFVFRSINMHIGHTLVLATLCPFQILNHAFHLRWVNGVEFGPWTGKDKTRSSTSPLQRIVPGLAGRKRGRPNLHWGQPVCGPRIEIVTFRKWNGALTTQLYDDVIATLTGPLSFDAWGLNQVLLISVAV